MKYLSGFLLLLAFSRASWAGCDEVTSQCLVIDGQEERSESCEIAICANMNDYIVDVSLENGGTIFMRQDNQLQLIRVNGKQGIFIRPSPEKRDQTCYAMADKSLTYCLPDAVL
ncbi:hypothetical protein D0436_11390 [Shewanella decolorationis]|uniref:Lysozyme inhibitor n=1 Tax=Shewanella decolorationis TaxID=256839 RepID=A0A5B8QYL7_9GAMM|nr:hypothetical protein [Shewanella decolorationis]QDZ91019.1 hypothetical protein D0436_11390 [Shewanella decolorationis]